MRLFFLHLFPPQRDLWQLFFPIYKAPPYFKSVLSFAGRAPGHVIPIFAVDRLELATEALLAKQEIIIFECETKAPRLDGLTDILFICGLCTP